MEQMHTLLRRATQGWMSRGIADCLRTTFCVRVTLDAARVDEEMTSIRHLCSPIYAVTATDDSMRAMISSVDFGAIWATVAEIMPIVIREGRAAGTASMLSRCAGDGRRCRPAAGAPHAIRRRAGLRAGAHAALRTSSHYQRSVKMMDAMDIVASSPPGDDEGSLPRRGEAAGAGRRSPINQEIRRGRIFTRCLRAMPRRRRGRSAMLFARFTSEMRRRASGVTAITTRRQPAPHAHFGDRGRSSTASGFQPYAMADPRNRRARCRDEGV